MIFNRNKTDDSEDKTPITEYTAADWDSDDSGVLRASMRYETSELTLDYEFDDVNFDIHVNGGEVMITSADNSTDRWRSVSTYVDADTAEELAAQFALAAKIAREERSADIRL